MLLCDPALAPLSHAFRSLPERHTFGVVNSRTVFSIPHCITAVEEHLAQQAKRPTHVHV